MDANFGDLVSRMDQELRSGPEVYHPSRFWGRLNTLHEEQLSEHGVGSFKRTVNQSYFNWLLGVRDPQVQALARWSVRHPRPQVTRARLQDWALFESQARRNPFRSRKRRWLYQLAVATLWERAAIVDRLGLLRS